MWLCLLDHVNDWLGAHLSITSMENLDSPQGSDIGSFITSPPGAPITITATTGTQYTWKMGQK